MEDMLSSQPAPRTTAEYKAAIDQILTEIRRLNEQMRADRAEYARLRAESQELKRETRAILASMGLSV